ncbi:hypothetical protein APHAL10511_008407 [Amanita phalloides]|nr:hypothetical protein APHAL10511_008407 [Amanita phalloides]
MVTSTDAAPANSHASTTDSANANPQLQDLNEFTMLTMLLHLVIILKNGNGNATMKNFAENTADDSDIFKDQEVEMMLLEAVTTLLVLDREVITACCLGQNDVVLASDQNFLSNTMELTADDTGLLSDIAGDDSQPEMNLYGGIPIKVSMEDRLLHIATAANPKLSQLRPSETKNSNPHNLTMVSTNVTGYWQDIKNDDMHCLVSQLAQGKDQSIPLIDHIATVHSYLDDFKRTPDSRSDFSRRFFWYLLSMCWRKMYQQITSWQGLGIRELLKPESTEPEPDSHNKTLVSFLSHSKDLINGLKHAFRQPDEISFDKLMAAKSLGQAFYTRETAVEFHDLVYAALVTYARDIDDFHTQFKMNLLKKFESVADVQLSDGLKDAFNGLEWMTRLLLCILTSSAFKVHVKIITNRGALLHYLKPTFENRDLYRSYANLILGSQSTKSITTSITRGAKRDPEMDAPVPAEGASLDEFKRWSRVFISHFIAKRTLEIQCRKDNFSLGNTSLLNAECS